MNATINQEIYNTQVGLEGYIKDLDTLNIVASIRRKEYYENKAKDLQDLYILDNFIWFDRCGNMWSKTRNDKDTFESHTYSPIRIPTQKDFCPYCGKDFNIYKLNDIYRDSDGNFYHKKCNLFNKLNQAQADFINIFNEVYNLNEINFRVIPNQYSDWEGYEPWFVVSTPDGKIEIGWRKRVISIEWLEDYKKFNDKFEDQDVTREFNNETRLIHAWSREKCMEYLNRARNSIAC